MQAERADNKLSYFRNFDRRSAVAPVKDTFVQVVANANIALTSQSLGDMVH